MNIDVYFIICKFINIIIFVIIFTRYSRKKTLQHHIIYELNLPPFLHYHNLNLSDQNTIKALNLTAT